MNRFWTWSGLAFGYQKDNCLYTYDGKHIGKFYGDEIYDRDGKYLGEVKKKSRLITDKSKAALRESSFSPLVGSGYVPSVDYVGYVMYVGFEDFPDPNNF